MEKLTGFSFSHVCKLHAYSVFSFSAFRAYVSWSAKTLFCFPSTTACVWVCVLVFCCCRSVHVLFLFSHFFNFLFCLLMRVLCLFLVWGPNLIYTCRHTVLPPRSIFPVIMQCPFLSTCVIQRLYLFADRKLKTWLYYVNVLVKLFPLHGVGWYKLCGMFSDLLLARRDMQRVVRDAGLCCPALVFNVAGPLTCLRVLRTRFVYYYG